MKRPETMIRDYESANAVPKSGSLRLYTYVRPRANGEATVEVWGACNKMRTKAKNLGVKHFFTFRTEDDKYLVRDILHYTTYCRCAHDHLCYHAPEIGGMDYRYHIGDDVGEWGYNYVTKTRDVHLPTYATMLNGFGETKYKWCAYDPMCGMPVMKYLELYREFPKAEILSKMKQFQLLTKSFLTRLEDKDFLKYVSKNHATICLHHMEEAAVATAYKRGKTCEQYIAKIMNARKERDRIAEERRIAEELKRTEEMRKSYRKWNKKMRALYERIKSICGQYGAYEVIVPKTSDEMLDEGIKMHNCIGKCYTSNHAMGHDIIIFLHKDGKPCVDMRIDPKKMEIVECRFVCNKDAKLDPEVMLRANEVLAKFVRVWKDAA